MAQESSKRGCYARFSGAFGGLGALCTPWGHPTDPVSAVLCPWGEGRHKLERLQNLRLCPIVPTDMLAALVATLIFVPQSGALACAVSGDALRPGEPTVDALGARFRFCGSDCAGKFKADPPQYVAAAARAGRVAGTFLFDPASGKRLSANIVRGGYATHAGIRYGFENPRNRAAFEAEPAKFTPAAAEVMYCPVMEMPLANLYGTSGLVNVDGMRVYLCCNNCLGKMRKNPGAYANLARAKAAPPNAFDVPTALSQITWPPQ